MSAQSGVQTQAAPGAPMGLVIALVVALVLTLPIFIGAGFFFYMTKDITVFLLGVVLGLMPAIILSVVLFFVWRGRRESGRATAT